MTIPFPIGLGRMGSTFLTATAAASSSTEPEVEELLEKIRGTVLKDCAKSKSNTRSIFCFKNVNYPDYITIEKSWEHHI